MKIFINEETGEKEGVVQGTLKCVSEEIRTLDNENQTLFRWAKVGIVYPNGNTAVVDSMLWEALLEDSSESFVPGNTVSLIVKLEGDYAGHSNVGLPTIPKIDISQFNLENLEVKYFEGEEQSDSYDDDNFKNDQQQEFEIGIQEAENMIDMYTYTSIKEKANEPSYLTGVLINNYFNEYQHIYDSKEASEKLISDFYIIHYGGKKIEDNNIKKIVENFSGNLPLLILCVYLEDIVDDDDDMVILCILNKKVVYKIILDVYNEICPPSEKMEFEFNNSIELKILECLE